MGVRRSLFTDSLAASLLAVLFATVGCHTHVVSGVQAKAAARAAVATDRQEMEQIPPPSKSRYMAIHSYDAWENPYITVQPDMITVHILLADANPSGYGVGGMLRPIGARRQEVNVSLNKLDAAMTAIPQGSWPYGRVVAVEEAHQTPGPEKSVVRRNLENTVGTLNDLGILAYDLNEGQLR